MYLFKMYIVSNQPIIHQIYNPGTNLTDSDPTDVQTTRIMKGCHRINLLCFLVVSFRS